MYNCTSLSHSSGARQLPSHRTTNIAPRVLRNILYLVLPLPLNFHFFSLPLTSHLSSSPALFYSIQLSLLFSALFFFVRSSSPKQRKDPTKEDTTMIDTWQTISSFLAPATLFLLLNLVIATIVLSSRNHHSRTHQPDPSGTPLAGAYHFPLLRTTSPVLERLRSFTLHRFRSGEIPTDPVYSSPTPVSNPNPIPTESEPHQISNGSDTGNHGEFATTPSAPPLAGTSSILDRLKSINLYRFRSGEIQTEEVKTETATGTSTEHHYGRSHSESSRPAEKKKKMKKTVNVGGDGGDADMEVRQRRSFRGRDVKVEEEVDARADDFINRFKQQLKIQRLNSILNYKEMLNRGN